MRTSTTGRARSVRCVRTAPARATDPSAPLLVSCAVGWPEGPRSTRSETALEANAPGPPPTCWTDSSGVIEAEPAGEGITPASGPSSVARTRRSDDETVGVPSWPRPRCRPLRDQAPPTRRRSAGDLTGHLSAAGCLTCSIGPDISRSARVRGLLPANGPNSTESHDDVGRCVLSWSSRGGQGCPAPIRPTIDASGSPF
jgi:hypothetical protein